MGESLSGGDHSGLSGGLFLGSGVFDCLFCVMELWMGWSTLTFSGIEED